MTRPATNTLVVTVDELRALQASKASYRVLNTVPIQVLDIVHIPETGQGEQSSVQVSTYSAAPKDQAAISEEVFFEGSGSVTTHLFERNVPLFVIEIDQESELRRLARVSKECETRLQGALTELHTVCGRMERAEHDAEELRRDLALAQATLHKSESKRLAAREALRNTLTDQQWADTFPDDEAGVGGVDF